MRRRRRENHPLPVQAETLDFAICGRKVVMFSTTRADAAGTGSSRPEREDSMRKLLALVAALLVLAPALALAPRAEASIYWTTLRPPAIWHAKLNGRAVDHRFINHAPRPHGARGRGHSRLLDLPLRQNRARQPERQRGGPFVPRRDPIPGGSPSTTAHIYWAQLRPRQGGARQPQRHRRRPNVHQTCGQSRGGCGRANTPTGLLDQRRWL